MDVKLMHRQGHSLRQIGRVTGLDAGEVAAALAELELAGLVTESAGLYRGVRPAG